MLRTYVEIAKDHHAVWLTTRHARQVYGGIINAFKRIISARAIMSQLGDTLDDQRTSFTTRDCFLGKHWKITIEEIDGHGS